MPFETAAALGPRGLLRVEAVPRPPARLLPRMHPLISRFTLQSEALTESVLGLYSKPKLNKHAPAYARPTTPA